MFSCQCEFRCLEKSNKPASENRNGDLVQYGFLTVLVGDKELIQFSADYDKLFKLYGNKKKNEVITVNIKHISVSRYDNSKVSYTIAL